MTTLIDDMWLHVLDQLRDDYRTLGRMIRVSRWMFALTAPVLYGGLFSPHPKHDQFLSWSQVRRKRLVWLLLISSGFIVQDQDPKTRENEERLDMIMSERIRQHFSPTATTATDVDQQEITLQDFDLWTPRFKEPLSIDYYGLVKQVPENLPEFSTKNHPSLARAISGSDNTLEYLVHHARVMNKLVVESKGQIFRDLIPFVDRFSTLKTIQWTYFQYTNQQQAEDEELEDFREDALDFIQLHGTLFPGQLVSVEAMSVDPPLEQPQFHILANMLIGPRKLVFAPDVVIEDSGISSPLFRAVTRLQLYQRKSPTDREDVGKLLSQCRHLEKVEITARNQSGHHKKIFEWAVQERERFLRRQQQQQHQHQHHHQRQQQDDTESQPLVTLKNLKLFGHRPPILLDAMRAFSDCLEKLFYVGTSIELLTVIRWTWAMTTLHTIALHDCTIDLNSLNACIALRDLTLSYVGTAWATYPTVPKEDRVWHALPWLHRLSIEWRTATPVLVLESLNRVSGLTEFVIRQNESGRWNNRPQLPSRMDAEVKNFNFGQLERLTLSATFFEKWGWAWMEGCPKLRFLALMDFTLEEADVVDQQQQQQREVSDHDEQHPSDEHDDDDVKVASAPRSAKQPNLTCLRLPMLEVLRIVGWRTEKATTYARLLQVLGGHADDQDQELLFPSLRILHLECGITELSSRQPLAPEFSLPLVHLMKHRQGYLEYVQLHQPWFERGFIDQWMQPMSTILKPLPDVKHTAAGWTELDNHHGSGLAASAVVVGLNTTTMSAVIRDEGGESVSSRQSYRQLELWKMRS